NKDDLNTVVNKLYRRNIVYDKKIQFPEGVALGEDGIFNMYFMSEASSIKYLDYCGYHYREVAGSATRNIESKDYFGRALEVFKMDVPPFYYSLMEHQKISEMKSIKWIRNVISYIHVYFTTSNKMSYRQRSQYINQMI